MKQSVLDFMLVLKNSAYVVLLMLACLFVNAYFFLPDLAQLKNGLDLRVLIDVNICLIVYVFIYMLTLLVVGYELINHDEKNFLDYFKSRFVKLLTDLTKAYNQILLLSLLLILPGVYRYIRLIFVPYMSMESTEEDCLKRSTDLTGGLKIFLSILAVYLVFIPLDLIVTLVPNSSIANTILISILSLSPIYYHCLIINFYKNVSKKLK